MRSRLINPVGAILIGDGGIIVSRYERDQRTVIWSGTGIKRLEVVGYDFAGGGSRRPFAGVPLTLWIDGRSHATVPSSTGSVYFDIDLDALPEGWHWLDVTGASTETAIPAPIYRRRGAVASPQQLMPILTHSHEMIFPTFGRNEELLWKVPAAEQCTIFFGMVPARFDPVVSPLTPRTCPSFANELPASDMVCTQISPCRLTDIHRTTITSDGVLTTSGNQAYHFADFIDKVPQWSLLDGPRGKGNVVAPTHLQVGRDGKIYGTDPWRMFKVAADGTVQTLVGWRHGAPPSNYRSPPVLELVGDWSAIPAARQGLHEAWGFTWDERTLVVNEAAQPLPNENNEKPHLNGPVAFIADTQNNRILRVEFSPVSHAVPAKVTEFIVGLSDPWDVVYRKGELFVAERTAHRIAVYNATTGAFVRVLIQGAALATIDVNRKPRYNANVTLAQIKAQPCVLPEGLDIVDDSLYFGSRTMEQVKRINLLTGQVDKVQEIYTDGNSMFAKIAVSDGTFLPKGTIFVATWSSRKYGYPHAYLPDGREFQLLPDSPRLGNLWGDGGYTTAVGVGQGRLVCGDVQEGLIMLSKALPNESVKPANAGAGALEYWRKGYRYTHGYNGWGHYGLPVPWGVSADIDAFLTYVGHKR